MFSRSTRNFLHYTHTTHLFKGSKGGSAGRCMAPIAENYHFWAQKKRMLFHCIAWHCIILHGIELYLLVLHCILWYYIGIAWHCMLLQDVALYCTVSHCIVLNFTVLHGIALYHCWLRRVGCISQDTYLLYYHRKVI